MLAESAALEKHPSPQKLIKEVSYVLIVSLILLLKKKANSRGK